MHGVASGKCDSMRLSLTKLESSGTSFLSDLEEAVRKEYSTLHFNVVFSVVYFRDFLKRYLNNNDVGRLRSYVLAPRGPAASAASAVEPAAVSRTNTSDSMDSRPIAALRR